MYTDDVHKMIILIRHAQSEGNKNRDIHQYVPDHRVKLTPDGQQQALEAGRRLRHLLKPDDTIQFFTSPYRRTRETTEGILRTLTSNDDEFGPSPFPRDKIKVYEEPRLREQDFGNFQPCSAEMERMWQERADYGHFFYRIPSGESAADAYDRVSGFNESLWRQFGDADFPSVCVLVTHGLMTRVFLMKWYHWSVEYFEDLRNINHCEFIIMKKDSDNGKFILQNELRTWSDLKRKAAAATAANPSEKEKAKQDAAAAAARPTRMWGGCAMGCNHAHLDYPRRPRRQNTQDFMGNSSNSKPAELTEPSTSENTTTTTGSDADGDSSSPLPSPPKKAPSGLHLPLRSKSQKGQPRPTSLLTRLGRDGGGSQSGLGSPNDISDEADDSDWFDTNVHQLHKRMSVSSSSNPARSELSRSALSQINEGLSSSPQGKGTDNRRTNSPRRSSRSGSLSRNRSGSLSNKQKRSESVKSLARKGNVLSEKEMIEESGMNNGRRADALGDVDSETEAEREKIKDRASFSEVY